MYSTFVHMYSTFVHMYSIFVHMYSTFVHMYSTFAHTFCAFYCKAGYLHMYIHITCVTFVQLWKARPAQFYHNWLCISDLQIIELYIYDLFFLLCFDEICSEVPFSQFYRPKYLHIATFVFNVSKAQYEKFSQNEWKCHR
jgi:hypothetical protein